MPFKKTREERLRDFQEQITRSGDPEPGALVGAAAPMESAEDLLERAAREYAAYREIQTLTFVTQTAFDRVEEPQRTWAYPLGVVLDSQKP